MRVGVIDFDSKQVNLATMKLSAFHKAQGDTVVLNPTSPAQVDKTYCSVLFSWNREAALRLADNFSNIEFGGTGFDLTTTLPAEVEAMQPDYDLYSADIIASRIKGIMTREKRMEKAQTIVNAGVGRLSVGCIRGCSFCVVPKKEGKLRRVAELSSLINPRSKVVTLLDNNITALPDCVEILTEAYDRGLILDLTSGVDLRLINEEISSILGKVSHLRSLHYAWDIPGNERAITEGIAILSKSVKKWKHLCFVLTGFDTTFEEDNYRVRRLTEIGVDPYIMTYKGQGGVTDPFDALRLKHFARWINGRIFKKCPDFNDYTNWIKAQTSLGQMDLLLA